MEEFNLLDQLSTAELEQILKEELREDQPNGDRVRMVMKILRARDAENPVEVPQRVKEAWEQFSQQSPREPEPVRKPIRLWVCRAASLAAILCVVLLCLTPKAAQAETWWEKLSRWSGEIYEFFSPEDAQFDHSTYVFHTENPGLQKVYDTIAELGVTEPVVPMWLPEGYELVECVVTPARAKTGVRAFFVDDEGNETTFLVDVYSADTWHEYHKDEENVLVYETNGDYFRIMRNNDEYVVIWEKGKTECSFSAICTEDTLHKIINSIYTLEDK